MASDKAAPFGNPSTILLVEDENDSHFLVDLLKDNGYDLLCANSTEQAIQHLQDFKGKIHLTLTDIKVGKENGIELANLLASQRPEMKLMLFSGYGFGTLVFDHGWHFLPQPLMPHMLTNKPSMDVRHVLERIRGIKLLATVAHFEFVTGVEYRGHRLLAVAATEFNEILAKIAALTEDEADSVEPFFTPLEIHLSFLRSAVFLGVPRNSR